LKVLFHFAGRLGGLEPRGTNLLARSSTVKGKGCLIFGLEIFEGPAKGPDCSLPFLVHFISFPPSTPYLMESDVGESGRENLLL